MDDFISRQAAIDELDEQIALCDKALKSFEISMKDEYAVKVERASLRAYKEQLEAIPAADVVPVVRCKDCCYRVDPDKCCHPDGLLRRKNDDFCSYGEREEKTEMMKWKAEEKGYSCNDCFLAMQNCHDMSIACEDETGLCDYFEDMNGERKE